MITHYDIVSGEVLAIEHDAGPEDRPTPPANATALRLMGVQEAVAIDHPEPRLPADIVDVPVALWLNRMKRD